MRLRAEGNKIVDGAGQVVVLRGANIINYYWKYRSNRRDNQFDLKALVDLFDKWNGMAATIWFAAGPVNRNEPEFMDFLDKCVDTATGRKRYLILSFAGPEPDVGTHPYLIPSSGITAHARLAKRYAHVPNVLHACQAEPGEWVRSGNHTKWRQLRDAQEATIDAIRREKPDVLIGVSGTNWSQTVDWMVNDPVRRANVFVKPHLYEGRKSGTSMERTVGSSGAEAIGRTLPIVVGEFGSGGRSNDEDCRVLIRVCEERHWGYQAWNLNNEGPPVLLTAKDTNKRNSYGDLVLAEMKDRKSPVSPDTGPLPDPPPVSIPFRVNIGGGPLAEDGKTWEPDAPWTGRSRYGFLPMTAGNANHNTGPNNLLSTERWGLQEYRVRVPPGKYDVALHFAETFEGITGPGERVFDVRVGDQELLGLDVLKEAGFRNPLVKMVKAVETDGLMTVKFTKRTEEPMIKAIEVLSETPSGPEPDAGGGIEKEELLHQLAQIQEKVTRLELAFGRIREAVAAPEDPHD